LPFAWLSPGVWQRVKKLMRLPPLSSRGLSTLSPAAAEKDWTEVYDRECNKKRRLAVQVVG
jgi:hypothetical protein